MAVKKRHAQLGGWFAVFLAINSQATWAESACRAIDFEESKGLAGVDLSMTLQTDAATFAVTSGSPQDGIPTVRIGDRVDICFSSNRAGLVSLWSFSADSTQKPPTRLLPNRNTTIGEDLSGYQIETGETLCISDVLNPDRPVELSVQPPAGPHAALFLHFTENEEAQIFEHSFPTIGSKSLTPDIDSCKENDLIYSEFSAVAEDAVYASVAINYTIEAAAED